MRPGPIAVLLACLLVSPPGRAAPPASVVLVVRGECPDEAAVRAALSGVLPATRLDPPPASAGAATVEISDLGARYRVTVGAETRHLDDPLRDCGERARALAVVVAMALDPLGL